MKYLKDKNSRRRGVAIELAVSMLLIMVAMSTIIVATTMIQIEKQKSSVNDLKSLYTEIEKIEYDQVGLYFEKVVLDEVCSLETNLESNYLNELSYCLIINENYDNKSTDIKATVETKLKEKLDIKFEELKTTRKLEFKISFNIEEIIKSDPVQTNKTETEEIVTIINTINLNYKITYSLEIIKTKEEQVKVLSVKNKTNLNQLVTITSKYQKQYQLVLIDEIINYEVENNTVEVELKEGAYLSFIENNNIKSISISTADDESIVSYFALQQQNIEEQRDCRITAKEGSIGKSINIILQYEKKIESLDNSDNPELTLVDEDVPQYELKSLHIKITVVSEYTSNSNENNDATEEEINNAVLLENIELDIIIKRYVRTDKIYIENGDVHLKNQDVYLYQIYNSNLEKKTVRTQWEYK